MPVQAALCPRISRGCKPLNNCRWRGRKNCFAFDVQEKKPTAVAVILDTSGSMGISGSMEKAKQNMEQFVAQLSDDDYLLPVTFNTNVTVLHPMDR
jgi:hypothetical protein